MKVEKKVISDLTLCYWVTTLSVKDELRFLVASEKAYSCLLFDPYGNQTDEVWKEPGGTMTAVQVPGSDGAFLATHRMYSPDDNKEASIVLAYPTEDGWKIKTLYHLPGVHRFDILRRSGVNYLIACTIKSDYEFEGDWRFPGKVLVAQLPEDLDSLPEENDLPLTVLKDGLLKNHGYSRDLHNGVETAIVTSEEGVFRFTPPAEPGGAWAIEQYLDEPTSDALFLDLDGDGEKEMLTLSPFHGDTLKVFKRKAERYDLVFEYEKKLPFIHAICPADFDSREIAIIGYRAGERDLLAVSYEDGSYHVEILDHDVGPANARAAVIDGKTVVVSANREINEVAYYTLEP